MSAAHQLSIFDDEMPVPVCLHPRNADTGAVRRLTLGILLDNYRCAMHPWPSIRSQTASTPEQAVGELRHWIAGMGGMAEVW